jgi:replication factor A1
VPEGEYLAVLSMKYSIDSDRLFRVLVSAKEQEKVMCDNLSIECRGRSRGGKIFLIMDDSTVVAQIIVSEGFLSERDNPISKFKDCERIRRYMAKKAACTFRLSAVNELIVGMNRVNLSAKVLELQEPKSVHTRFGNSMFVAYALIGDNSGTVKLSLWGEQIGSVSVGDSVQISNARIRAFRGEKQLQIGRNGSLKVDHNCLQPNVMG